MRPVYHGSQKPDVETFPLCPPASPLAVPGAAAFGQPTSYYGTPPHQSLNCHHPPLLSRPSLASPLTPTQPSHVESAPTTEQTNNTPHRIPASPPHGHPKSNPSLQHQACHMNAHATMASSESSGLVTSPSITSTAYSGGAIEEWDEDLEGLIHVMSSEWRVEPASLPSGGTDVHIHIYPSNLTF